MLAFSWVLKRSPRDLNTIRCCCQLVMKGWESVPRDLNTIRCCFQMVLKGWESVPRDLNTVLAFSWVLKRSPRNMNTIRCCFQLGGETLRMCPP